MKLLAVIVIGVIVAGLILYGVRLMGGPWDEWDEEEDGK